MALSRGRDYNLTSLKGFFSLVPEIGHIKLMVHCINNFPYENHRYVLEGHSIGAHAAVFSPDGQTLASASSDRIMRL
jgi:hypothetical protein